MLLTRAVLDAIRAGEIDLVYRLWRKPTVKPGGRLRTSIGELAIGAVEVVDPGAISDESARRAGYPSAETLRADLFRSRTTTSTTPAAKKTSTGTSRGRTARPDETSVVYRIEVSYAGEDARAALRESPLDEHGVSEVLRRLAGSDRRSPRGPWTQDVLALIATWPERRAPELAEMLGRETLAFKADVRKLKELGLTESLRIGYRLSPRGQQVLAALRAAENTSGAATEGR